MSNRFGRRLFEIFFKTYTEKVWGIPCTEISADWAAQRIKNLDLLKAVRTAILGAGQEAVITTLIDRFLYPRLGPGMMWERCRDLLAERGTPTLIGRPRRRASATPAGASSRSRRADRDGSTRELPADHVISLDADRRGSCWRSTRRPRRRCSPRRAPCATATS